jgi:pyruvate dehydrogenase E1 component alpha subunit
MKTNFNIQKETQKLSDVLATIREKIKNDKNLQSIFSKIIDLENQILNLNQITVPDNLGVKRNVNISKEQLINFEKEIIEVFESGKIKAPVHLSGNNEDALIEIFQYVDSNDWVFSTWRSHYHGLLHGVPFDWMKKEILAGRSITLCNPDYKFYTSAIVGGIIPQAVGVALGLKLEQKTNEKVWCFIGDMAYKTGIFHEAYNYAINNDLPIQFVVEDNGLSTNTPTLESWGIKNEEKNSEYNVVENIKEKILYYRYKRIFPHQGSGKWITFGLTFLIFVSQFLNHFHNIY